MIKKARDLRPGDELVGYGIVLAINVPRIGGMVFRIWEDDFRNHEIADWEIIYEPRPRK